jgi:hypothetical protein
MDSLISSLSEGRAVYVMYFPTSSRIHAVVVNPFRNKELSPAFLEKQFRDACQTPGPLHENLTFHVRRKDNLNLTLLFSMLSSDSLILSFRWTTIHQMMQVANLCKECYLSTGMPFSV